MSEKMKLKVRDSLFVTIAFLLGGANILYNVELYVLWVLVTVFFVWIDYQKFVENVKRNWKYLVLPLVGVVYLVGHYLVSLWIGNFQYHSSWNRLEILLLYFFFIPIYYVSTLEFVNVSLIRRSLLGLCWGTMLFNFIKLFYLTGWTLFTAPEAALDMLYDSRFGWHLYFLGGHVYLEPQAIYLSISAIIASFFILESIGQANRRLTLNGSVLFLLSIWFLSLTVTKGAILAFLCGFFILAVGVFYRMSLRQRLLTVSVVVVFALGIYAVMPDSYIERGKEIQMEIQDLQEGELVGESIAPRVGLIKESFDRFDQWGLWGLGVYKNAMAREWFSHSQYPLVPRLGSNVHNCFLEFWMIGGIPGLLFILYYFFAPVGQMIKKRRYSLLFLAIICALFVGCNTSALIVFVDSVPLIVFLLAMSFFYLDQWVQSEEKAKA